MRLRMLPPPVCLLLLLTLVLASGCDPLGALQERQQRRITLTGSSTMAPLMNEIGKRFEQRRPGVRVDVQSGGTSRGIADTRNGLADIGMVSRDLKDDEADLHGFAVARDGICLIVHRDNPVEGLSADQVVGVFTGRIDNWKEVGGPDSPIAVVNKAEGRSTLELFTAYFRLESKQIRADVVIGDNEQGLKTVAGSRQAIGYVSIGAAEFNRELGSPIKLLPVGGVEASTENVAGGSFPLARTLHLVTKAPPSGLVQEFVEFAQSSEAHDLVEELSFVPIR